MPLSAPISLDVIALDPALVNDLPAQALASLAVKVATIQGAIVSAQFLLLARAAAQQTPIATPTLLDAKQLAAHLGVPETWVREQTRQGLIPHHTVGRYIRFRLEEVQAAFSQGRR